MKTNTHKHKHTQDDEQHTAPSQNPRFAVQDIQARAERAVQLYPALIQDADHQHRVRAVVNTLKSHCERVDYSAVYETARVERQGALTEVKMNRMSSLPRSWHRLKQEIRDLGHNITHRIDTSSVVVKVLLNQ